MSEFNTNLTPGSIKSAMANVSAGRRDLWQVEPQSLKVIEDFNVRIKDEAYQTHIRWLADSMKEEGFYQDKPLAGYVAKVGDEQVIYITDGHCRREAVLLAISEGAEITKVPVVVSQAGVSMEDLTVVMVRGNGGKSLTPYEIGLVCKRLARFGMEITVIAKRIGFTVPYVSGLLNLMAAPIELRNMVIEGVISASMAMEMLNEHGDKALEKLQEAQSRAAEQGKERVTKKHTTPDHVFHKVVKKASVNMFNAITEVKADPGYNGLSEEIRSKLESLLTEIADKQK